ncbi:transcriptional regulator domain-containing protein [Bartonella sp. LJL80]
MKPEIIDWHKSSSYQFLIDYNADDFAWEFLRRNHNYQSLYEKWKSAFLSFQFLETDNIWGLDFRG